MDYLDETFLNDVSSIVETSNEIVEDPLIIETNDQSFPSDVSAILMETSYEIAEDPLNIEDPYTDKTLPNEVTAIASTQHETSECLLDIECNEDLWDVEYLQRVSSMEITQDAYKPTFKETVKAALDELSDDLDSILDGKMSY